VEKDEKDSKDLQDLRELKALADMLKGRVMPGASW
jgi:hypothetical protein